MSQDHHKKEASGAPAANDRREFMRQSLGVAPLMLTLGGRSHGGKASMHGTLWSSLGTHWKHKGRWWDWRGRRWRWSKKSGHQYRERKANVRRHRDEPDWRVDDKPVPARRDWDFRKSEDQWRRELEAEERRQASTRARTGAGLRKTDPSYDWRQDGDWKRSEGLSPFLSDKSSRKKD